MRCGTKPNRFRWERRDPEGAKLMERGSRDLDARVSETKKTARNDDIGGQVKSRQPAASKNPCREDLKQKAST